MKTKTRIFGLLATLMLLASCAFAQTTTTTATTDDPDGIAWASGTYSIQYSNAVPGKPYNTSTGSFITTLYTGTLNSSGQLSVTLDDVKYINPAGGTWVFTICPDVSGGSGNCATVSIPVTGASESVSSQINAALRAPRPGGGIGAYGYADVEFQAVPNNSYVQSPALTACRIYTNAWSSCGSDSGNGSVGTSGQVQIVGSSAGSFAAGAATDNGTAFSISEPVSVAGLVTASGYASSGATQGYFTLVQNATAAPTQPANSYELLAPQSGLTSSYSNIVPLLAPAAANSVMVSPNGGGQLTWNVPAFLNLANTFTTNQIINTSNSGTPYSLAITSTASSDELILSGPASQGTNLFMQTTGEHAMDFFTGGSGAGTNALGLYDATASSVNLIWGAATAGSGAAYFVTSTLGRIGWIASGNFAEAPDTAFSRGAAGVIDVGTGAQGNTQGTIDASQYAAGTIYSAAGTALPTCNSGTKGQKAVVSDATSPTYLGTYTSGGAVVAPVFCNGSGWVTD